MCIDYLLAKQADSYLLSISEKLVNLLEIVHVMASSLDQLKKVTVVVADTGDFGGKSHVRSWGWGSGEG